jgi:hypothetical protein
MLSSADWGIKTVVSNSRITYFVFHIAYSAFYSEKNAGVIHNTEYALSYDGRHHP